MARVKITVMSDSSAPALVDAVAAAFADGAAIHGEDAERLRGFVESLVRFTREHAYPDDPWGEIEVTLDAADGFVHVDVHDWGLPLKSAGGDLGPLPPALAAPAETAEDLRLVNLGAEGKRLTGQLRIPTAAGRASTHHVEASTRRARGATEAEGAFEIREATVEDAEDIAQLLYENYHLSYVHPDFYRPRHLIAELDAGRLLSTVAVHDGSIVGHHALMRAPDDPAAETGAAVVHSAYRGLGLFGRLFESTIERAQRLGLAAIFGDAVTIHPFSQRTEREHGYRESALMLGTVPARVTMRGLGSTEPGRRTALLRSYRLFDESSRRVELPTAYRETLELVYDGLGLALGPRGSTEDEEPLVTTDDDSERDLGFLRVRRWNDGAREEVTHAVRELLSRHEDVVYADVDLQAVADVDSAVSCLNELGFFLAGVVVHGQEGHDHVRLQRLNSEAVELENVVCDSPFAEELKARVLEDRARVDPS